MSPAAPAWKADLDRDGWVVVPGAVPPERCAAYCQRALEWFEHFPLGFKHDDRSTWSQSHLPISSGGGLITGYGEAHLDWVWEARCEERVMDAFAEIWGTDELIVSFDAINISLPIGEGKREDMKQLEPWPHMDQQPNPEGQEPCEHILTQGQVCLSPSGPEDGGLIVLSGSSVLQRQFFEETGVKESQSSGARNFYKYTDADVDWFLSHGCKWTKVNTSPGDLILWDSRTIHWAVLPEGETTRVTVYVCAYPAAKFTPDQLERKKDLFQRKEGTTHWPQMGTVPREHNGHGALRDGKPCPHDDNTPNKLPTFDERMLKLAGAVPY